jgi:casein kinase 1
MKLNNGKGWEAMKTHPSAAHLNHGIPNSSNRELHGQPRAPKAQIPHDRLNADLPKPGATRAAAGPSRHPQRRPGEPGGYGSDAQLAGKRQSTQDFRHPEGSTAAQFPHSQQNLGQRGSSAQPGMQQQMQNQQQNRGNLEEQKMSPWQKFMKVLCCG